MPTLTAKAYWKCATDPERGRTRLDAVGLSRSSRPIEQAASSHQSRQSCCHFHHDRRSCYRSHRTKPCCWCSRCAAVHRQKRNRRSSLVLTSVEKWNAPWLVSYVSVGLRVQPAGAQARGEMVADGLLDSQRHPGLPQEIASIRLSSQIGGTLPPAVEVPSEKRMAAQVSPRGFSGFLQTGATDAKHYEQSPANGSHSSSDAHAAGRGRSKPARAGAQCRTVSARGAAGSRAGRAVRTLVSA